MATKKSKKKAPRRPAKSAKKRMPSPKKLARRGGKLTRKKTATKKKAVKAKVKRKPVARKKAAPKKVAKKKTAKKKVAKKPIKKSTKKLVAIKPQPVKKQSPAKKQAVKIEKPVAAPVIVEESVEKSIMPETVSSIQDDRDAGSNTLKEGIAETENNKDGSNGAMM